MTYDHQAAAENIAVVAKAALALGGEPPACAAVALVTANQTADAGRRADHVMLARMASATARYQQTLLEAWRAHAVAHGRDPDSDAIRAALNIPEPPEPPQPEGDHQP